MNRAKNGRFKKLIPFFHPQSIKMWGSIFALLAGIYATWEGFDGCEKNRVEKNLSVESIPKIQSEIQWLVDRRFEDSIRETQRLDDIYDSLYDHRADLDELYRRSHSARIMFRGQ
jgi:hypothetical protein